MRTRRWACGLTTVPERLDLLGRTLQSLAAGGFDKPRLFIDGSEARDNRWDKFQLDVTHRTAPKVRTFGNWMLGLAELYVRSPTAHLYAMFQDDLVSVKNLRAYLERCHYPEKGYWNLFTFPENQAVAPPGGKGWFEAAQVRVLGPKPSEEKAHIKQQVGRGAVGLVFSREAVQILLGSARTVAKVAEVDGWRRLDGTIAEAMNRAGWREFCHSPSLIQHVGAQSVMGNMPHPLAPSFPGEDWDALSGR